MGCAQPSACGAGRVESREQGDGSGGRHVAATEKLGWLELAVRVSPFPDILDRVFLFDYASSIVGKQELLFPINDMYTAILGEIQFRSRRSLLKIHVRDIFVQLLSDVKKTFHRNTICTTPRMSSFNFQ